MKNTSKHEHLTISIPQDVKRDLKAQYKLAGKDEKRTQEFKLWEDSMIGDGLNEANDW